MLRSASAKRPDRSRADFFGAGALGELSRQPLNWDGQELFERGECRRLGASIKEHAEDARQIDALHVGPGKKPLHAAEIVMRDDLREEELAGKPIVGEVLDLLGRIGMWIRPAAQGQPRNVPSNLSAQFPRVIDASRRPDRAIAAEHDQRWKSFVPGALGIRQAELERMLRREC